MKIEIWILYSLDWVLLCYLAFQSEADLLSQIEKTSISGSTASVNSHFSGQGWIHWVSSSQKENLGSRSQGRAGLACKEMCYRAEGMTYGAPSTPSVQLSLKTCAKHHCFWGRSLVTFTPPSPSLWTTHYCELQNTNYHWKILYFCWICFFLFAFYF